MFDATLLKEEDMLLSTQPGNATIVLEFHVPQEPGPIPGALEAHKTA